MWGSMAPQTAHKSRENASHNDIECKWVIAGCELCHGDIPQRRRAKGSEFCSKKCEGRYGAIRSPALQCIQCEICRKSVAILHVKGVHKYCSPACFAKRRFKMTEAEYEQYSRRVCPRCGVQFTSTARRFCSKECCNRNQCDTAKAKRKAGSLKRLQNCTVCGARCTKTQCSDHCRTIARMAKCESCGNKFLKAATGRHRFCGPCATARKNRSDNVRGRQRRAKTKTVRVTMTPREIWQRDGGRCGLCRKKIDISRKWPDKMALAIDHIIPLSKGGEDTPENVQATHAKCNGRKNNRAGSQRRLFG